MEINLIAETLKFLVLGMSTVFMFLILLVFVMQMQAKIMTKYFPHEEEKAVVNSNTNQRTSQRENLAVIAAIAASIKSYTQTKQ